MYEKHFSFKCKPFELVPNPDFLFPSTTHKKAISYLDYGIKAKIGFILLSGEVGSGKTTIVRNLIKNLNGSIKLSRINYTKVSSEQLISMINKDFGLIVEDKSKAKLLSELNDFLIDQYVSGNQPILLIDEAQNLSSDLLEEIRLLSNLETDKSKLIQIILVGQPELKNMLMLPELVQLKQRININYHITPLSIDETSEYIKHRLAVAGNAEVIMLADDVRQIIYDFSRGIPRLINILCDFALLSAFTKGQKEVGFNTVLEVSKDLEAYDYWNNASSGFAATHKTLADKSEHGKNSEDVSNRLKKLEEGMAKLTASNEGKMISKVFEDLVEKMVYQILMNMSDDDMPADLSDRISKLKKMSPIQSEAIKVKKVVDE